MNKMAKAAIISAVIFLVFALASAAFFVAAAPQIPEYVDSMSDRANNFLGRFLQWIPDVEGQYYDKDGIVDFSIDNGEIHFRFKDNENSERDKGEKGNKNQSDASSSETSSALSPDLPSVSSQTP